MSAEEFEKWTAGLVAAVRERREARLRAVVDEAVKKAVGEVVENGGAAKPLHEMTSEEWRAHARGVWEAAGMPQARRPMTINEWIAGRYEDDGEA
ncbi:MAG: hypothetical protein HOY79_40280 [Streptomyces sp.]|nr:hypothetical protein [Streptomyces sp.]